MTEARPRQLDGYRIVCTVLNCSSVGISDVAIQLKMQAGELERDGEISMESVVFAHRALAAGDSMQLQFPHVVRLAEVTFDTEAERGPGYSAALFWRDESGKRWKRRDGGRATGCRARDFPVLPS